MTRIKRKVPKTLPTKKKVPGIPFFKGDPRAGRPFGCKNKFTSLKQSFLDAFEELGGVDGLVKWAKKSNNNRATFYNMLKSMLPKDVQLSSPTESPDSLPFTIRVEKAK
jgi:hypothetical protein